MPNALSIIVPVYNEAGALADSLPQFAAALAELPSGSALILVDDGSTDAGSDLLRDWAARQDPDQVRVITHPRNRGYGAALKSGARAAETDLIAFCDADGTYPINRIASLANLLAKSDAGMVVGARSVSDQPAIRRPAKALLIALAEYLTRERIPDLNSGLRVLRREALNRHIGLLPDGFSLTTTITIALLNDGEKVLFEPISYARRIGTSKIRPIRDTMNFTLLILRTTLAFDPLRVYGPIGAALLLAGGAFLIARLVLPNPVGIATTVVLFTSGIQILGLGLLADLVNRRTRH